MKTKQTFEDVVQSVEYIVERATECRGIYPEFEILRTSIVSLDTHVFDQLFKYYVEGLKNKELPFDYWMLYDIDPDRILNKKNGTIRYIFYVRADDVEIIFETIRYNIAVGDPYETD